MTLIELLIAMAITGMLGAGVYRTFVGQQHTYEVQDQIVDMQQNVRMAISRMTRELRMAGFGKLGATFFDGGGMHGAYQHVVTPGGDGKSVTVVAALQTLGTLSQTRRPVGRTSWSAMGRLSTWTTINTSPSMESKATKYQKIDGNQIHFKRMG